MARPLVIIHGWSDDYKSFKRLGKKLADKEIVSSVEHIKLGDYVSLDDDVTFDDLVNALQNAWERQNLPTTAGSVDCIVHSTGGLIIRDWIESHYEPDNVPIKHLLMLAPANFGSPLAHKGRSFIGRVVKGWKSDKMFETGARILKGLELASPYSWQLAMRDRFGSKVYFNSGKVLCTVLVGNTGYTGISAAANENGTDGTVRVSTANLNCAFLDIDFTTDPFNPTYSLKNSRGKTAFAVLDGENHSTIAAKDRGPKSPLAMDFIIEALTVTDGKFDDFRNRLNKHTREVMKSTIDDDYKHGYQNTVFLVEDQFGNHIQDYFLEFYVDDEDDNWFTGMFQRQAIRKVHNYVDDTAYRSVYVDCSTLHRQIDKVKEKLELSLTATPELSRNGNVGYRTFTDADIGSIKLDTKQVRKLFVQNRTLLVRICLKREQSPQLFTFKEV